MAWVKQEFSAHGLNVLLEDDGVSVNEFAIWLQPRSRDEAHDWAMMLRKAARRLEEIGKGLS